VFLKQPAYRVFSDQQQSFSLPVPILYENITSPITIKIGRKKAQKAQKSSTCLVSKVSAALISGCFHRKGAEIAEGNYLFPFC